MPSHLALLIALVFCSVMLWRDTRLQPPVSRAIWLPVIWIFIIGSRFISQWLEAVGIQAASGARNLEDGSPIDAGFFLVLLLVGIVVLWRRRLMLTTLVSQNRWLTVFFLYCFLAIWWSDFPFVAFKRWIKVLGHPVMALIILTERDRLEAARR